MTDTLTLLRPDDWHAHVRQGAVMRAVLPFTASAFGRAIVMPNLKPPVTTTALAKAYREDIRAALPAGANFTPLMTLYLTDTTNADELVRGFKEGVLTAAKLYPAGATTNAASGVTNIKMIYPVLSRMQEIGLPLSVHGENMDPDVEVMDREAVFIDRILIPLRRDFPELKIVFEHISTAKGAAYVADEGKKGKLAGTITAHHLHINRNMIFAGGLHPHYYCLPMVGSEKDRLALIGAATSGNPMYFLGTDSAPHPDSAKESSCIPGGIFTALNAIELYAQIFDDAGKLDKLEAFASRNGPAFYGLPVNETEITLKKGTCADLKPILTEDEQKITPFQPPSPVLWERMA